MNSSWNLWNLYISLYSSSWLTEFLCESVTQTLYSWLLPYPPNSVVLQSSLMNVIFSPSPLHATILVQAFTSSNFTFVGCDRRLLHDFVGFLKTLITDISFDSALHHKEGNFQKLTEKSTHEFISSYWYKTTFSISYHLKRE